jgi:DNA-binding NarL/FixJ family response regulator
VCMARNRQPDVVLVDYRMPGMDGIEAIGLMKMEAPLTQAVMLTVYDDHALNLEAERAQVYCLLVKGSLQRSSSTWSDAPARTSASSNADSDNSQTRRPPPRSPVTLERGSRHLEVSGHHLARRSRSGRHQRLRPA